MAYLGATGCTGTDMARCLEGVEHNIALDCGGSAYHALGFTASTP